MNSPRLSLSRLSKLFALSPLFFLLSACATTGDNINTGFGTRPDVQMFIQEVSARDDFSKSSLTDLFNHVTPRPIVIHHTSAPHETTLRWDTYRAIFIQPQRIQEGTEFYQTHQQAFLDAQQKYGVPPEIIAGIIGVETRYGKFMGKYRVIDSLSTLGFEYSPRKAFFQNELEQYLLLTRDLHLDPLSLKGSYAGAVGLPQFMPDSYRRLAVSADGSTPDLWHNPDDAILSVAHYFQKSGWESNQPVAIRADIRGTRYRALETEGLEPHYTLGELARAGVTPKSNWTHPLSASMPVSLLILPTRSGSEYWIVFHNFYVITRYNHSAYYAMAVYQLAQAIQAKIYQATNSGEN